MIRTVTRWFSSAIAEITEEGASADEGAGIPNPAIHGLSCCAPLGLRTYNLPPMPVLRKVSRGIVFRAGMALRLPGRFQRALFCRELPILMYHGLVRKPLPVPDTCFISESRFVRHMTYLRAHFEVLPLSEAVVRLKAGKIDHPTAVITFDDGFQSIHDIALPLLQRLGLPATMFLNTGFVDQAATIWFCRLHQALSQTRLHHFRWHGTEFDISRTTGKAAASVSLQEHLKEVPHDELMIELDALLGELGVAPDALSPPAPPYRILDSASILAMERSKLFEFGAHTTHHAILSRVSPLQARAEILDSVKMTESLTGQPCRLFAYPNGTAQDYNASTMDILEEAGIVAAVTTRDDSNTPDTPPLELQRYGVGTGGAVERLEMTVAAAFGNGT